MEGMRPESALVATIVACGALREEPFVVVDVGCGIGIDPGWRSFGDDLVVFGFDPNIDEIERLRMMESHPGVHYEAGWVGLPPGHPFLLPAGRPRLSHNPWGRLSTVPALERLSAGTPGELATQNRWQETRLAPDEQVIVLPEFLRERGIAHVDFLKVDVDGADFEVLVSVDALLRAASIGVGMEVNYFGSTAPTDHTFHNTDRYLRECGLELFGLTTRTYSAAALPARFVYPTPAQTVSGRILQGDAVYFRDLVSPENESLLRSVPVPRLLKLAGLFDLFGLPDCSAEVLLAARDRIEPTIPVEPLLDLLVPEPWASSMSYREYLARFAEDDAMFYPEAWA